MSQQSSPQDPNLDPKLYEKHDPDLLQKLGATPLRDRRWTLGNSASLVRDAEKEPLWISVAWIVIPLLAGIAFVGWMAGS